MRNGSDKRSMISIPDVRGADVVFDLDGTLLHGDLGETVFYHLLLHDMELGDPRNDPFMQSDSQIAINCRGRTAQILALYQALHHRGREERAYKLTARIIGRYSVEHVRKVAKGILELDVGPFDRKCRIELPNGGQLEYVLYYGARIRQRMVYLVRHLHSTGARIWIVSASPQPVVEGCGDLLGIPNSNVLAATVSRGNYKIIRFPWARDKAEVLREAGVVNPRIAFGNGLEDLELLLLAEHAVVMADGNSTLLDEANRRHWDVLEPMTKFIFCD
jgi:phosphoserine phosphatase